MCDPSIQPAMCSAVQGACKEFPKTATDLISDYGIEITEYVDLSNRMRKNAFFSFRIRRELNRLGGKFIE